MKPEITKIDDAIAIVVTCCQECPYVVKSNSHEYICNQLSRVVAKPYARERVVNPTCITEGCPLLAAVEPDLYEVALP